MVTPRVSQRLVPPIAGLEAPQHQLRELNRNILGSVASFLSNDATVITSQHLASDALPQDSGRRPTTRAEYEAQQRKKEHVAKHLNLLQTRKRDEKLIKEQRERSVQAREQRFEAMLDRIDKEDAVRVEAARTIRDYESERSKKKQDLYEKWDAEVSQRIEHHLARFMTKVPPPKPAGLDREHLLKSDDPVKTFVRDLQAEESFHRVANAIIQGSPRQEVSEQVNDRRLIAEAVANRERCRPMLPVEHWDQQHHYALPCGCFTQGYQNEGYRTARRMGTDTHRIDESDGVTAAGKTKTKYEKNQLRMLEGNLAREGESARHKQVHGASSGAPCQDHFHFDQGIQIVDAEFPRGKRMYPLLSGAALLEAVS